MPDLEEVQRALGDVCIIVDGNLHQRSPKLSSVEPGSAEAFYMVAAFCFDLSRKLDYIFKATRRFAREGYTDADIAREVREDNQTLYGSRDRSWRELAEESEKIMLRLFREIDEEHRRLLEQATRKR
jgi:hypothetical protein